MDREISLIRYLKKLLENIWLIILLTVVCGLLLYSYSAFLATPMYTSSAKMLASNRTYNQSTDIISNSDMYARSSLVKTYAQIVKSNTLMTMVCEKIDSHKNLDGYEYLLDSNHTPASLAKSVKVASIDNTEVFSISMTLDDPDEAQFIVNAITDILPDMVDEKMKSSSTSVIDPADHPTKPSSPNIFRNTVLGAVIGFLIAAAIIFVILLSDTVIHSEEDLTEVLENATLLGTIPLIFHDPEKSSSTQTGSSNGRQPSENLR